MILEVKRKMKYLKKYMINKKIDLINLKISIYYLIIKHKDVSS